MAPAHSPSPHEPQQPHEPQEPQQSRGDQHSPKWWIAPVALTVLAVPGSVVLFFLMALGGMAFDPCSPGGCPGTEQHYNASGGTALFSLVPVVAVWCFPHRRSYTVARIGMIAVYILLFLMVFSSMLTIPVGE